MAKGPMLSGDQYDDGDGNSPSDMLAGQQYQQAPQAAPPMMPQKKAPPAFLKKGKGKAKGKGKFPF